MLVSSITPEQRAALQPARAPIGTKPYVNGGPLCWEDQGAYLVMQDYMLMDFDYVQHERSDIWAEVHVMTSQPGMEGSLLRQRINLQRGNSRRDVVNQLTAKTKGTGVDFDWDAMMEQAVRYVVDRVREGRPAILLREAAEPETTQWLLEPLILGRRSTIWFGDGESAKSYSALAAAATIQSGHPYIGLTPSAPVSVAYLDWEWDDWEHKRRLDEMGAGTLDIVYIDCKGVPLADQTDRIRRQLREHHCQFIVVDSAAYACNGEPENSDVTMRFFRALDSFNLGSLVLAHTTKLGVEDKPFGSQFWYASARLIWFLKKEQEEGSNSLRVAFINKKSNAGPKPPPMALQYTWESGLVEITKTDWREMNNVMEKMPLTKRIAYAVSREPKTYAELADELETTVESVRKTVDRATKMFVKITRAVDRVTVIGLRASG